MGTVTDHIPPCKPLSELIEWSNGNGVPGAKTRLALLENDVDDIKSTLKEIRGWVVGAAITVIAGVVLWSVTFLFPALLKLI
jgi:hypothetical protein